ncbi:josephin-like protein [Acrasis kona]|uniref:ubiquitinyl hydrolase 1 n=1 Tax=Acrasis kona TaxID=1008807 RepID=A0AAW2ZL04_9EUKA
MSYESNLPLLTRIYHERQSRMFCGMHAINNLLQLPISERYNNNEMDSIAEKMYEREKSILTEDYSIKNNHRSSYFFLSFGNYSYEVVCEALTNRNCSMESVQIESPFSDWHVGEREVVGLICNVREKGMNSLCLPKSCFKTSTHQSLRTGHWFSIGKIYNVMRARDEENHPDTNYQEEYLWYNHDSRFKIPKRLNDDRELFHFIRRLDDERGIQVWKVVKNL